MSFAKNIREQRERLGLSVQQAADRIGVTKGAVQNWERDREGKTGKRKHPKREHMQKLANLYHQPIELLYRWAQEDDELGAVSSSNISAPPPNYGTDTLPHKSDAELKQVNEPRRKMKQPPARPHIATPKKDLEFCEVRTQESSYSISLTEQDRLGHTLVLGASGTGKTECAMIPMLYQDIKDHNTNLVVMDAGGSLPFMAHVMASAEGRPVEMFDPRMSYCPTFEPLQDMGHDDIAPMLNEIFDLYLQLTRKIPSLAEEQTAKKALMNAASILTHLSKAGNENALSLKNLTHIIDMDDEGQHLLQTHRLIDMFVNRALSSEAREMSIWFQECYQGKDNFIYDAARLASRMLHGLLEDKCLQHIYAPTEKDAAEREHLSIREAMENNTVICINITDWHWPHLLTCKLLAHHIASVCANCLPQNGGPIYWYIDEASTFLTTDILRKLPYLGEIKTGVIAAMQANPFYCHDGYLLSIFKNVIQFHGPITEETAIELAKRGTDLPAFEEKKSHFFKKTADPAVKEGYERVRDWCAQPQREYGGILFRRQKKGIIQPLALGYRAPLAADLRASLEQHARSLKERLILKPEASDNKSNTHI